MASCQHPWCGEPRNFATTPPTETYGHKLQLRSRRSTESAMSLSPISPTNNRNDDMSASLIARLQRRLNDLSSQQEKLVENREQLLVDRESVCMNRKTIAEQRTRTANTEIACLNALRKHFHDLERPLPNDLIIAYDEVEKHHLRLRTLEEEYLQAEESLGASEWTFSEQESDFYQHQLEILLSEELDEDGVEYRPIEVIRTRTPIDAITPTRSVHYQAVLADHDRLVKRFDALRKQQTLRMDTFTGDSWTRLAEDVKMDHEAMQLAGDLLDLIARCEVRLQQLRPCLDTSASVMLRKKRQASEPVFDCNGSYEHIEPISCAKSEGGVQPHDDSLHAGGDITGWSLESLKSNALEKLQYLNVLRSKMKHTELLEEDFEYWEPLVTRTWAGEYGEWQTPPERDLPAAPGCLERETKLSAVERDWDENSVAKLHVSDSHMSSPACKYDTASDCRDKTVQIISSHAYATTHSRDITSDVEREIVRCRTSQYDAGSLPVSITTLQNIVEPAGQSMMLQDCRNQLSEASMDIKLQSVSNKPHKDCHIAAAKKSNAVGEWSFLMLFFGRMISSATEYIPWTWAPLLLLHECLSLEKVSLGLSQKFGHQMLSKITTNPPENSLISHYCQKLGSGTTSKLYTPTPSEIVFAIDSRTCRSLHPDTSALLILSESMPFVIVKKKDELTTYVLVRRKQGRDMWKSAFQSLT